MTLTLAQRTTLKAYIVSQPDLQTNGDIVALTSLLNVTAAPEFWVWRSAVTREDVYTLQNDLVIGGAQTGFWSWTTYKNQAATEQNAWTQMFMGDVANFGRTNVRDGVASIFTGSAAANAQRDHILSIGRRKASRVERVFTTGTGSAASPGVLGPEGPIEVADVIAVMNT